MYILVYIYREREQRERDIQKEREKEVDRKSGSNCLGLSLLLFPYIYSYMYVYIKKRDREKTCPINEYNSKSIHVVYSYPLKELLTSVYSLRGLSCVASVNSRPRLMRSLLSLAPSLPACGGPVACSGNSMEIIFLVYI